MASRNVNGTSARFKNIREELGMEESTETFTDDTGIAEQAIAGAEAIGQ